MFVSHFESPRCRQASHPLRRVLLALLCACLAFADALAAAPQAMTQAPGFYRIMLGDVEITALSDGVFELKPSEMLTPPAAKAKELLSRSFHGDSLTTSVNAYLVNTGDRLVLVDTGAAQLFGPALGKLLVNLAASGYRPEQVDAVLVTHMHPDHIGGLARAGAMAFPNATLHADRREADFWLSAERRRGAPAARKGFFEGAAAAIAPYASAGRFKSFESPAEPVPGFRALPAPGHTPGHTMFVIESKGQKLVFWGDLTEIASVQLAQPTVNLAFDGDGPEAARQRSRAYAHAARGRYLVAGAHLPFPGIGHVGVEGGGGYVWVPIDYQAVP